jgi:hypothetical protein
MNYLVSLTKKHKKKIAILLAVLGIILIVIVVRNIKINEIKCFNQFGECNDRQTSELDKFRGSGYFTVKKKVNNYLSNEISINSYNIQYQFPDVLQINLIELVPSFGLSRSDLELTAMVDKSGKVLSLEKSTNAPVIQITGDLPQIGNLVSQEQLFALNFVYDVVSTAKIKNARILEHSLEIEYEDGIKVLAPLSGDREVIIGSLLLIKSQLNSVSEESKIDTGNSFHEIDLRYKNPILR